MLHFYFLLLHAAHLAVLSHFTITGSTPHTMDEQPTLNHNQLPVIDDTNNLHETTLGRQETTLQPHRTYQPPSSSQQRRQKQYASIGWIFPSLL